MRMESLDASCRAVNRGICRCCCYNRCNAQPRRWRHARRAKAAEGVLQLCGNGVRLTGHVDAAVQARVAAVVAKHACDGQRVPLRSAQGRWLARGGANHLGCVANRRRFACVSLAGSEPSMYVKARQA